MASKKKSSQIRVPFELISFPSIQAKLNFPSQSKYYRVHIGELVSENRCQWKKEPSIVYIKSMNMVTLEKFQPLLQHNWFISNSFLSTGKKKKCVKKTKANRLGYSQIILLTIEWLHVYPASKPISYQLNTQLLPTMDWFSDVRKEPSGLISKISMKIRGEQAEWNKQYFSIWFAIRKKEEGGFNFDCEVG